jgi:hypothetical protein
MIADRQGLGEVEVATLILAPPAARPVPVAFDHDQPKRRVRAKMAPVFG